MEISNNLIPTLLTADSPSQPSEGNPQVAKSVKKKVPGEESSFDGALATTLATVKTETQPKDLGKLTDFIQAQKGQEQTDQVELSKKGKASAATAAKADSGAQAPTIASLFQAKAEDSAKGPMAGAFVAGPDQPWGSRWVFAGGNQPAPEEIEAIRTTGGKPPPLMKGELGLDQLKKLVAQAQAQGGDGSQLKQAAESTLTQLDSAIAELGGKLENVRVNPQLEVAEGSSDTESAPIAAPPSVFGGAEFVSALQGAKNRPSENTSGQQQGGRSNGRPPMTLVGVGEGFDTEALDTGTARNPSSLRANATKPSLQSLPGGHADTGELKGGRLEGGLRLPKDDPKLQTDTFYPSGMPLTAVRSDGQAAAIPPQTITGHVVPGAMMRERLTSESLRNVANGISGMTVAGGGEMRIRLNPGNLGELMIRVTTNGKDVGLKVHANDPGAKKVIEESLGALRDSLTAQNLALGRVDVVVATNSTSQTDLGQNSQQSSNQAAFTGFDGQNSSQGRSMDGFGGSEDRSSRSTSSDSDRVVPRGISSRIAAMNATGRTAAASAASRLDVMA